MKDQSNRLFASLRRATLALSMMIAVIAPTAQADDLDIYINPDTASLAAPYTILVLDLNLIGICDPAGVVTPITSGNATSPQLCLNYTSNITLNTLLTSVLPSTTTPSAFLTQLLGTLGASALCDIAGSLPGLNLCGLLGGLLGSLTSTVNGLVNPLLNTYVSALPAAVLGLLNTTLNGVTNLGQTNLLSLVGSILGNLVNSNVAIVVSHADRSNLTGAPAANCSFAEKDAIPNVRRNTTNCSNGAYVLLPFTLLAGPSTVTSVLATLTNKLTNTLSPANLLNSTTALLGTALTTPQSLLPPYQGKEVYAEITHYLAGKDIYNAPLSRWDGLTGLLTRDTSIEQADGNYAKPDLGACSAANVLNIQLTPSAVDSESDATLRAYFPALPGGSFTLADVVQQAGSDTGFLDKNGKNIKLKSYFLVQDVLGSAQSLANAGATLLTYTDSLGLLNRGKSVAELLKPTLSVDASLVTASLTADLTNPSSLRPESFFALFRPDAAKRPRWNGDVKRLAVTYNTSTNTYVYSASGSSASAIDATDGRIAKGALTFWTNSATLPTAVDTTCRSGATVDGRCSAVGGAGQGIPRYKAGGGGNPGRSNTDSNSSTRRTLYYDHIATGVFNLGALDADTLTTGTSATAINELIPDLGAAAETASVCGTATGKTAAQVAQEQLLYARGYDTGSSCSGSKGSSSLAGRDWLHGAVLHSRPVAINYGSTTSAGTPDIRVLYGAGDGFVRLVRNSTGAETWGFMPRVIMGQQKTLRDNAPGAVLPYGADGAPAVLVQDRNPSGGPADGVIQSNNSNDRVWAYFGLRRSGRHYYGMDLTNPDSPRLLWRIGPDGRYTPSGLVANSAGDFPELALGFSSPQIGRMRFGTGTNRAVRPVLVFGGGYNGGRDASGTRLGKDLNRGSAGLVGTNDSVGNAVYIVDAETGALLWKAVNGSYRATRAATTPATGFVEQHPMLEDGIAASVTLLDTDGDGLSDRLYVADTGGRLWRGDFPALASASSATDDRNGWALYPVASVGRHTSSGSNTVADDRRFFQAPDYAPIRGAAGGFDVITFGSGDREDPTNKSTVNWLYAYRDARTAIGLPDTIPTTDAAVTAPADLTDLTTACNTETASSCTVGNFGWRVRFTGSGEKAFSQPLSTGGVVYLSTYIPPGAAGGCVPTEGSSRLYGLALTNGQPRVRQFIDDTDGDQRSTLANSPGLPGEIDALTAGALTVGAQNLTLPQNPQYPIYWRERRGDEENGR